MSTTDRVVHMTCGLPGSGKSTLARRLVAESAGRVRRVNLDDIRLMLDGPGGQQHWTDEREATALAIQDAAIRAALDAGHDLVVDNTHLTKHIPARVRQVVAGRARFVVHDLTHVRLDECLRRDATRVRPVGEEVLRRLAAAHEKSLRNGWRLTEDWLNAGPVTGEFGAELYVPRPGTPKAVLCDIDGTLALRGNRGPYDFTRCGGDVLNEPVARTLALHARSGDVIVLMSGREETYRPQTEEWLNRHLVPYAELHMRPAGDTRRDDVVKRELFDRHVRDRFHVRMSLDDRDRVVALWRRLGLPTWQVNPGDF